MADSHVPDSPHLTPTEARQGFRGRHILWVLIISVSLAVIAMAAVWGYHAHDLNAADAGKSARMNAAAGQPQTPPVSRPQSSY
jgi:hypothetical protein